MLANGSGNANATCKGRTNGVTDYGYTGQRHETGFGLMDYNARYYSPRLGRFISPDTIVPDPTTAKGFNRYLYADGNPLKYTDPSGHAVQCRTCDPLTLDYSSISGIANTTVDLAATAYCFFAGCHVDRDRDTITGPSHEEWAEQMTSSVIGMVNPVGTTGGRLAGSAGRWLNQATQAGSQAPVKTLSSFTRAAEFGIDTYRNLGNKVPQGSGLQRHHIVEKRFARSLGLNENDMLSIVLTAAEHQKFTNQWREAIGRIGDKNPINTVNATKEQIWSAAQRIYAEYPELLEAARKTILGE